MDSLSNIYLNFIPEYVTCVSPCTLCYEQLKKNPLFDTSKCIHCKKLYWQSKGLKSHKEEKS